MIPYSTRVIYPILFVEESIKATSMENVSTGVLEKIRNNIQEVNIKPKNDMMYQDIYNCICQNTKKIKIYHPLCHTYSPIVVLKSISKRWTNMHEASG